MIPGDALQRQESTSTLSPGTPSRVIAYIDGFNLYFGLRAKGWERFRWLDVVALVEFFIRPPQVLSDVRYFTAGTTHPPARYRKHTTYLNALRRARGIEAIEGKVEPRQMECPNCDHRWKRHQEKQSDVNIAMMMMRDAYDGAMDEAFVVSGDSDLVPVVKHLVDDRSIPVTLIKPPRRHSDELEEVASRSLHIIASRLGQAQLPNPIRYITASGKEREIFRPREWDPVPPDVGES